MGKITCSLDICLKGEDQPHIQCTISLIHIHSYFADQSLQQSIIPQSDSDNNEAPVTLADFWCSLVKDVGGKSVQQLKLNLTSCHLGCSLLHFCCPYLSPQPPTNLSYLTMNAATELAPGGSKPPLNRESEYNMKEEARGRHWHSQWTHVKVAVHMWQKSCLQENGNKTCNSIISR